MKSHHSGVLFYEKKIHVDMAILTRMLPSITEHNIALECKDKCKRLLFVKKYTFNSWTELFFRILLDAIDWSFRTAPLPIHKVIIITIF